MSRRTTFGTIIVVWFVTITTAVHSLTFPRPQPYLGNKSSSSRGHVRQATNDDDDDYFDLAGGRQAEHRWACPSLYNICEQTGITLSRYMLEMARANPELDEIESIVTSLQTACKTISSLVRRSSLQGLTGLEAGGGSVNVQGEEQKKLDVITNEVLKKALQWSGKLGTLASVSHSRET